MNYFKQGQVKLGAFAVSVGSTFRTDTPCLKKARNDVNLQGKEVIHGCLFRTLCAYGFVPSFLNSDYAASLLQ